MSYRSFVTLDCDHPGCVFVHQSFSATATGARLEAKAQGWVYVVRLRKDAGPAQTRDLCHQHATELDGYKVVG